MTYNSYRSYEPHDPEKSQRDQVAYLKERIAELEKINTDIIAVCIYKDAILTQLECRLGEAGDDDYWKHIATNGLKIQPTKLHPSKIDLSRFHRY